jgi:hypothetical protein
MKRKISRQQKYAWPTSAIYYPIRKRTESRTKEYSIVNKPIYDTSIFFARSIR